MISEETYMARALQIARLGFPFAMPNPMVGAVIVDEEGKIIGEGYHRKCGGPHAEVNAINSVTNQERLKKSTMYVTLEPCAHYGRTGPCAKLIIEKKIPKVVVGCRDPFEKVDGKGIEMLKEAGVEIKVGVLEKECRQLNAIFFTANTCHRPFILLKWAQSKDGYLDIKRTQGQSAAKISSLLTSMFVHRWRAVCDGILVGSNTVISDNPMLDTRLWPGKSPRPIILDRSGRIPANARIMERNPLIINSRAPLSEILADLYQQGFTSIMVEGGKEVLQSFINEGLWDIARIETSPCNFGETGAVHAPYFYGISPAKTYTIEGNQIEYYTQNSLIDVKNI